MIGRVMLIAQMCFVSMTMPTKHHDSVFIHITAIMPRAWFILSFASLKLSPLAPFLSFLLTGFKTDKWLCESNTVSCGMEKNEIKSRNWIPGLYRSAHLSSLQYWCPLCLWIIWLASVLPAQPVKSVTGGRGWLIISFWLMSLIVCQLRPVLMELAPQAKVQKILKCTLCLTQIRRQLWDDHPLPIISYLAHVYFLYHLSQITCLLARRVELTETFIRAADGHDLDLLQPVTP